MFRITLFLYVCILLHGDRKGIMAYFDANDVCFTDDGKKLVKSPVTLSGSYVIPYGVEIIASNAFKGCGKLTEIVIPKTVRTLENGAFEEAKAINSVKYEGTLEEWLQVVQTAYINSPHKLYIDGKLLEDLIIPTSCTIVPLHAFYYVRSIKSVTFHDGITEFAESAFNKSSINGNIILPKNLKAIRKYAFLSCESATGFEIPATVEHIEPDAFRYCNGVKKYVVSDDNPYYRNFANDLYNKSCTELIAIARRTYSFSHSFRVPFGVEILHNYVFADLPKQVNVIEIPNSIKTIEKFAFVNYNEKVKILDTKAQLLEDIGFPKDRIIYGHDYNPDLAHHTTILDFISKNPYRILGIPAGSPKEEINAAYDVLKGSVKSHISNFADVTDNLAPLKPVIRTSQTVENAYQELQDELSQIIYSLFWFYISTEAQEHMLQYLHAGMEGSAIDVFYKDAEGDTIQNRFIISILTGDHITAIDDLLELVTELSEDELEDRITVLLNATPTIDVYDVRTNILKVLLDNYDRDVFTNYISAESRFTIKELSEYIDDDSVINGDKDDKLEIVGDDKDALYASVPVLKSALQSAEKTYDSYSQLYNTTYYLSSIATSIFDKHGNKIKDCLPLFDATYKAGKRIVSNCVSAIRLTSDRKQRIDAVYLMTTAYPLLHLVDSNTDFTNALAEVKKTMDIIPPQKLAQQDCLIYEIMISWLTCESLSSLVLSFYPIIGPLYEVKTIACETSISPSGYQIITVKDYYQEVSDLICEMICNNIMRILNKIFPEKGKRLLPTTLKDIQIAYSLLVTIKKSFKISTQVQTGIITKAIGILLLILQKQGYPYSTNTDLFIFQSEDNYWKQAQANYNALSKYLLIFGKNGKHIPEAQVLLEKYSRQDKEMWNKCKTISDYQSYLKKTPFLTHKAEAEKIIKEKEANLSWVRALNVILLLSATIMAVILFSK